MATPRTRIGVVGAGAFGLALSHRVASGGHAPLLFTTIEERADALRSSRRLPEILPELKGLHEGVEITTDPAELAAACDLLILTSSSEFFDQVMTPVGEHLDGAHQVIHAHHTLNGPTLRTTSERIRDLSCVLQIGCLAGPIHVVGLLEGRPNAAVIGSAYPGIRRAVREVLGSRTFRVFNKHDILGVEVAAALGTVIALAVGIGDELDLGAATHATLLTAGLREFTHVGVHLGANAETFMGLAGVGRLVDALRRGGPNYQAGRAIAATEDLQEALATLSPDALCIDVLANLRAWSIEQHVDLPLVETLTRIVEGEASAAAALEEYFATGLQGEP